MSIARAALALPLRLNPNIKMTYQPNCMDTIASGVKQLLIDAKGEFPLAKVNMRVSYLSPSEYDSDYQDANVSLSIGLSNLDLCDALIELLNQYFSEGAHVGRDVPVYFEKEILSRNPRTKRAHNKKRPIEGCVVIAHPYIPRFLNEICRAVSLYSHRHYSYSLVRDFYLTGPEGAHATVAHDDKLRMALNKKYDALHQAYNFNPNVMYSGGEKEALYQRLNALAHAYHLGEVGASMPGFVNKITAKDERAQIVNRYRDNFLTLIRDGDLFYQLSKLWKDDPALRVAFISADNPFYPGDVAFTGGGGTPEAMLARVSNYLPRMLAQAELDQHDPQSILNNLYAHLQPTGLSLSLGEACGLFYLNGQTIPEYIARENVGAYATFGVNSLSAARSMAAHPPANYQDKYPVHKRTPHWVPGVKMLDAQGVVRSVNVVSVNLDYSSLGSTFQAEQDFYKEQWAIAFDAVLNHVDVLVLCDVSRHLIFSLSEVLARKADGLNEHGIRLIMPVDASQPNVYASYCGVMRIHLGNAQNPECQGGTAESCHAAIVKKYRELKGSKFDIENKTLVEIWAHALEKDRKTRSVLKALGYLAVNEVDELVPHPLAPQPMKEAYQAALNQDSPERIKERIVEVYKKLGGSKFDIQNKTLREILAHALTKDRKTRAALIALNYLEINANGELVLTGAVPDPVRNEYHLARDQHSSQYVKEIIIEAYKKLKGSFFYQRSEDLKTSFDISTASLEDIIAHAFEKDGITRQALLDLHYLNFNDNQQLELDDVVAPFAFQQSFANLLADVSEDRIRKNIIAKYRDIGGEKFDIANHSLQQILAHAMQKEGKTRAAFFALDYLELGEAGELHLSAQAPAVLRAALSKLEDEDSEQCIKARIIEAYKKTQPLFHKENGWSKSGFSVYAATLPEIFAHAKTNEGGVRRALTNLGYIIYQREDKTVALNPGCMPAVVKAAFNAPSPQPAPRL